jgi:hypothetical protein
MTIGGLKSMSTDELWSLREEVDSVLCSKISEEKAQLDHRLRQLKPKPGAASYRNPAQPSETRVDRGKAAALAQGAIKIRQEAR